jgi:hypothetical protein
MEAASAPEGKNLLIFLAPESLSRQLVRTLTQIEILFVDALVRRPLDVLVLAAVSVVLLLVGIAVSERNFNEICRAKKGGFCAHNFSQSTHPVRMKFDQ